MRIFWLSLVVAAWSGVASADAKPVAARSFVDEQLGRSVPRELTVTDQTGRRGPLGRFLGGERPVLVALAYYHCPGLCDLSLRQLATSLRAISWRLGQDYTALTVSFDPRDTPVKAAAKRGSVLALLQRDDSAWPFLVAAEPAIGLLTGALGYRYDYDAATKQYAHPAVSIVLTPEGRVSRYVYGPTYDGQTLQLALREARAGRTGASALIDRAILSCFQYDPHTRRYEWLILGVVRIGAGAFAVALAGAILVFIRRGRVRRSEG